MLMAGGVSASAALLLTNKSVRGAIASMLKVRPPDSNDQPERRNGSLRAAPSPTVAQRRHDFPFHNVRRWDNRSK